MDANAWISLIANFLGILSILAGLWLARGILPTLQSWLQSSKHKDLFSLRITKIILWLALGSLFSLPLLDLVNGLAYLSNFIPTPQSPNEITLLTGMVSTQVYLAVHIILKIIVYGAIVYLAMGYILTPGLFNQTGRTFIVLGIASLVVRGFEMIFNVVFTFQIPVENIQPGNGVTTYLVQMLAGIIIILVIFVGLYKFLPRPSSRISK